MKIELTDRGRELLTRPNLAGQFPYRFGSGKTWPGLDFICRSCNERLADCTVHGHVVSYNAQTLFVEAIGKCLLCKVFTEFAYYLHDDDRISNAEDENLDAWLSHPSLFGRLARAATSVLTLPGRKRDRAA